MSETILTLHPQGKQGVNINRAKYNVVREAILEAIHVGGQITFLELNQTVRSRLTGKFEGSVSWYVTTIKLDLEARHLIERVPGIRPQQLRIVAEQPPSDTNG
jgi:hypothetical protein